MGLEYNDQQDATMRLDGTICRYKDVPYYISVSAERNKVNLHDLGKGNKILETVKYTDPEFSYKPFPLGYINYYEEAYYMARSPDRRQKQGLCHNLIRFRNKGPGGSWFASKEMKATILGDYPTLGECLDTVYSGKSKKLAFHRYCAIERLNVSNVDLMFRDRKVGFMNKYHDRFTLYDGPEASFLYRILPQYGVKL